MQFAGQIWGQSPHATHFARPCSSVSMRCVPRQRDDSVQSLDDFSSGYCIVTLGRNRWLNVSAIPFSVARRYDVWRVGRFITFTPIAIYAASCGTEPETMRPRSSHHTSTTSITRFNPPSVHAMPVPYSHPSCDRKYQIAVATTV